MPVSSADLGPVLVTGASGFIGSSVVRALVARGAQVRALIAPGRDDDNLTGLPVERVVGDIRDAAAVDEAVDGISTVFHLAAVYRFWAADPKLFYDVNIGGTMNVLRAAERSQYLAEHEVLRAGAGGLPVVLVHPTFPVGEGDSAPTPTGRTIVEFLNGRIPAYVDTALNVVHVDDVARGHVLAAQSGRLGHSYILGGENMSLRELLATLADICGLAVPRVRLHPRVVLPIVRTAEWAEATVLRREPTLPSEPVRMATTRMEYDDSRARTELGYSSIPAREALVRAVRWYLEHGFVKPARAERIRGAPGLALERDRSDDADEVYERERLAT